MFDSQFCSLAVKYKKLGSEIWKKKKKKKKNMFPLWKYNILKICIIFW